jgi:hypothetical protein
VCILCCSCFARARCRVAADCSFLLRSFGCVFLSVLRFCLFGVSRRRLASSSASRCSSPVCLGVFVSRATSHCCHDSFQSVSIDAFPFAFSFALPTSMLC